MPFMKLRLPRASSRSPFFPSRLPLRGDGRVLVQSPGYFLTNEDKVEWERFAPARRQIHRATAEAGSFARDAGERVAGRGAARIRPAYPGIRSEKAVPRKLGSFSSFSDGPLALAGHQPPTRAATPALGDGRAPGIRRRQRTPTLTYNRAREAAEALRSRMTVTLVSIRTAPRELQTRTHQEYRARLPAHDRQPGLVRRPGRKCPPRPLPPLAPACSR